MSVESTRKVMQKYWDSEHSDVSVMAGDVVFRMMGSDLEKCSIGSITSPLMPGREHPAITATAATSKIDIRFMMELEFFDARMPTIDQGERPPPELRLTHAL